MRADRHKIHVMHIVDTMEVGGLENGIVNLANHIDKDLFRLSICCLKNLGSLSTRIQGAGSSIVSLGWVDGFRPKLFFELFRLFRDKEVDIVHTHGWSTLLYSSVACLCARVPVLINGEHGTFYLDVVRRKLIYKALAYFVDRYITVSHSLEVELARILKSNSGKIVTVPNGVDLQKYSPRSEEDVAAIRARFGIPVTAFVIGSVGRLEPVKNFEMLLRAYADLCKYHTNIHCVFIGDGSLRSGLETLALQLGVADHVHFTGKVDNPQLLVSILDLFICTSFNEGMSNAILEAMACGKPIIATNVGDNGKLVEEGRNGFLVESGDCHQLEKAIGLLLIDRQLCEKLGVESRAVAEDTYSIRRMISSYQDIYSQSIAEKRGVHVLR